MGYEFDDGPNCTQISFYDYLSSQDQNATMFLIGRLRSSTLFRKGMRFAVVSAFLFWHSFHDAEFLLTVGALRADTKTWSLVSSMSPSLLFHHRRLNDPDLGVVGGTKFSEPSRVRPVPNPVCRMGEAILFNSQSRQENYYTSYHKNGILLFKRRCTRI